MISKKTQVLEQQVKQELEYFPEADSISSQGKKYGICILCGDRVYSQEEFKVVKEGYCHTLCLVEASML